MPPLVLTIQSHVAFGHVGNSAAVFALQRLGMQPVAINTVQFSNHTGYGAFRGQVFDAPHIRDVLEGLRERGVLQRCRAVLSGYLGDAAIGEVIVSTVQELRCWQPDLVFLCDPVMGDTGRGLFVRDGIPSFHRERAVPNADLITPNQFEFEQLCGTPLTSLAQAIEEARQLLAGRPAWCVITSLRTPDLPPDTLHTLAVGPSEGWLVRTPYLPLEPLPNGMGDTFSAVLLAHRLKGRSWPDSLARAVSTLYGLVARTQPGERDLPLVAEQSLLVEPAQIFPAHAV